MADRIYVTYTPTGVPGSFHTAIHYQRTGQHGDVIEHLIIEAGPENKDLSPPEKIIGVIEEAIREGDEPSRFGSIQAKIRERRADELTEAASDDPNAPYEVIAEANDLSENVARMQLYALGFNRAGFAYRGDRQNSNTFAGAALSAGKLPAATGVAHDPIARPGELSEFFVPGLNEPLRTPIGRRSSDEPSASPALREAKYKIPAFPDIPVSTFAKEAPAETSASQAGNASTLGGVGRFTEHRLTGTGAAASSTRVGLPSRMVSSSFPGLTPGNPKQPSPQQPAPLLGIFSGKPMSPSPLPPSLWGMADNSDSSDEGNWFTRLGGAGPENATEPAVARLGDLMRALYR